MNIAELYKEQYIDKDFERLGLFRLIESFSHPERIIYPGCFVHVTPAFLFDHSTFIDNDKNAKKFFRDPALEEFIKSKRINPGPYSFKCYPQDYQTSIKDEMDRNDLMISQYAGFVSQACKHYLKLGGLLLVNNSHGDASMASLDKDYQFIAVVVLRNKKFKLKYDDLEEYFIPKRDIKVTREYIRERGSGIGYKRTANSYIFRRVN